LRAKRSIMLDSGHSSAFASLQNKIKEDVETVKQLVCRNSHHH
jgi:hypothetical protein